MKLKFISVFAFHVVAFALGLSTVSPAWGADGIPKAAWERPLGLPLANPGVTLKSGDIDDGYWQGVPVGGFGAGTFSRSYRGDFARWHMKAGVHKYEPVYANQFAMFQQSEGDAHGTAQALMNGHPTGGQLSSWQWDYPVGAGNYYALFPKAWFDYKWDKFPAHVTLEQYSPVLPGNYRESSYPVAVYRWHAENPTNKTVVVSVLLSWTNMSGWFRTFTRDFDGAPSQGNYNNYVSEKVGDAGTMKGIVFDRSRSGASPNEWDGQFAIAALESPGVEVTYQTTYQASGDGKAVWAPFSKDGRLTNDTKSWVSDKERLAGAIALRFTLKPGEKKIVPMVLSWDFPVVQFGEGRKWDRKYTDFYGTSGKNAWKIARDGLTQASAWSDAIDKWQAPYVNDESKPLWYRGMLFNELYALTDGGTFWGRQAGADLKGPTSFALLECFDYAYYGTLDVRFYASLPLLKFWPDIDKQVLREFADTVPKEWPELGLWVWKSQILDEPVTHKRKKIGAVPHDLGVPEGDPFIAVNEPGWQDTNNWKDLNSKFVLMVYRDYVLTGRKDTAFLRETWPAVKDAIEYLRQFDHGGGVPENSDYPDQTYDDWVVHGVSAYSGGLWLAALRATEETARILGDRKAVDEYHALFLKGQKTYISQLWNGKYFRYDTSTDSRNDIQTDQLAGQWYANLTGLGDIVPREMQIETAKTIFNFNVMKFGDGQMGAVNGMTEGGEILTNAEAKEVWVGTTLGYAGLLISEGMKDEAWKTTWGLYHVIYETKGYWFRTPEAWDITGNFRAGMYMRPTAVWALEMTPPPTK
ncbi:non-lysosomal glucosylceramidase [Silvibacterium bohemicum]|uniref:Non-lysosomal glucosylceramidase n=1 Tax=Silvibacterium bohemicum TaxID=1577686 RepID=A0A841JR11_9BACT|nr:GH116 family glycosyl hydrolase [Silvibacterium bohemicum]MBB6143590.1 non-lysosomal glucosylceramidase [Silvibacterium bohemicum]